MNSFFMDQLGNYYETVEPKETPEGHVVVSQKPGDYYDWNGTEWVNNPPPPATSLELDALADRVSDEMLEQDAKMKALALVMADLVERAFNVSPQVARQQVKTRFRGYYRGLLGS